MIFGSQRENMMIGLPLWTGTQPSQFQQALLDSHFLMLLQAWAPVAEREQGDVIVHAQGAAEQVHKWVTY